MEVTIKYINACDLKVGDQLSESDGFLWEVTEIIKETEKTITIRLNSDFSSLKSHWKGNVGVVKRFKKNTSLLAVCA